ncbi:MAG: D-alanine--D-alanine ligase, partial [Candidatus Nanopelagicales bacterium]
MTVSDQRVRVAVVFGGRSSEHTISCSTAGGVLAAIDRARFEVIPVGITREGAVTLQPDDPSRFAMNPEAMPEVADNGTRVLWPESAAP